MHLIVSDRKVADQNALLVLENVKVKGFTIGNRANGFDKNDAEVILEVCVHGTSLIYSFI